MGACAPVPRGAPPFNHFSDSTHFLTLSEAWDLEETKMAPGKWRACVELQVYTDFTVCIEPHHRGLKG